MVVTTAGLSQVLILAFCQIRCFASTQRCMVFLAVGTQGNNGESQVAWLHRRKIDNMVCCRRGVISTLSSPQKCDSGSKGFLDIYPGAPVWSTCLWVVLWVRNLDIARSVTLRAFLVRETLCRVRGGTARARDPPILSSGSIAADEPRPNVSDSSAASLLVRFGISIF